MRATEFRKPEGLPFAQLASDAECDVIRDHISDLPGVQIVACTTVLGSKAVIDFTYYGYSFSIWKQGAKWRFYARDASHSKKVASKIAAHCEGRYGRLQLLERRAS